MTPTLLCKLVTLSVSLAVSGAAIAAAYSEDNPTSELSSDAQKLEKLRKRAAQGLPDAQISLGMIYFTGVGATQDYVEAARWFRLAAQQGFPDARPELGLGMMYADGKDVPKDAKESLQWFKRAAEMGDTYGLSHVGTSYLMGDGTAVNYFEAYKWMTLCGSKCPGGLEAAAAIITRKLISPVQRLKADKWVRVWRPR